MRILIVNDDGIRSSGLISLARMAVELGEVWVAAPESQCSAMSHRISVFGAVGVQPEPDFPVNGVKAYSISGSPADCVKVALAYIMKERPDVVFSGINNGYNVGIDILYSGTVGAAMEALRRSLFQTEPMRTREYPNGICCRWRRICWRGRSRSMRYGM